MPQTLCRDRVLEVLKSVSVPLSTRQVTARMDFSRHTVGQNLRALREDQQVIRIGPSFAGRAGPKWIIQPPLVIQVYEDDTEEDRRFCRDLDRAMALTRRGWEQQL